MSDWTRCAYIHHWSGGCAWVAEYYTDDDGASGNGDNAMVQYFYSDTYESLSHVPDPRAWVAQ